MLRCSSNVRLDNDNNALNPDDSSSINDIKSEIRSLVKRKFELETQIASTQPQKFGNVLDVLGVTAPPLNVNYKEESYRLHFSKKLHFYKLCGIYARSEGDERRVFFRSIHNCKEYSVCVIRSGDRMEVAKHFLPPMVPLEELVENYLKNNSNIGGFFRKIYHYIVVYDNRISQMNDLKNSEDMKNIELFSSHSTHFIKLKVLLEGEFSRALNIHLKYPADFIFPQTLLLDGGNLSEKVKQALLKKCQDFKRMPLLEAVREVLPHLNSL